MLASKTQSNSRLRRLGTLISLNSFTQAFRPFIDIYISFGAIFNGDFEF